jgi:hypothetical protein
MDACEICGSDQVSEFLIDGEESLRCDRHAVGISKAAEAMYRRRCSSSHFELNPIKDKGNE